MIIGNNFSFPEIQFGIQYNFDSICNAIIFFANCNVIEIGIDIQSGEKQHTKGHEGLILHLVEVLKQVDIDLIFDIYNHSETPLAILKTEVLISSCENCNTFSKEQSIELLKLKHVKKASIPYPLMPISTVLKYATSNLALQAYYKVLHQLSREITIDEIRNCIIENSDKFLNQIYKIKCSQSLCGFIACPGIIFIRELHI